MEPRHRPQSHPRELLAELALSVSRDACPPGFGRPPKKRREKWWGGGQPRPQAVQTTPAWGRGFGGPSPLVMLPSPSSPSGAAALDLRPSVNTENKTVWPSLTQWGPPSQSPQGSRQSRGGQGSFKPRLPAAHPQGWLGWGGRAPAPAQAQPCPSSWWGRGQQAGDPWLTFSRWGLSHFLCHPCRATSHHWPSPGSWKTHFLGGWRWKLSGQDLGSSGVNPSWAGTSPGR